jgi:hypothetical protein
MRLRDSLIVFAVAASLAGEGAALRAEIIDRILAVVDGAIIMQSDVAVAMRLGLVASSGGPDPTSAALDRLIERQLILSEVDRYAPPDPADSEIDRRVADIRARAGTEFDGVLLLGGIDLEQLRREVRDDLRIDAYLQQRFGVGGQSAEETLQRAGTIKEWLTGLRRRADISVLPR